jgi:hypothetical protein
VEVVKLLLGAAAGFGVSLWLGYRVGVRCRKLPRWRYLAANVVGLAIGVALAVAGQQSAAQWLWLSGLGFMAGSLTGLKYGLGKTVKVLRSIGGTPGPGGKDR